MLVLIQPALAGDEVYINQHIQSTSGVIKLDAKTYVIDHPIKLDSGTVLQGVPGKTKILLRSRVSWPEWMPVIDAVNVRGARITGVTFDMNCDNQRPPVGKGYHIGVFLKGCSNIEIEHCVFINGKGDGIRCKTCSNIRVHDNNISRMGHDGIYFVDCKECSAEYNTVSTRTNSGIRDWNSVNVKINHNTITSQQDGKGGYAGVQIEFSKAFTSPSVTVSSNTFYRTQGPGVQLISYGQGVKNLQGVYITENTFTNTGVSTYIIDTGGISIKGLNGAVIRGNLFTGCYNAGILVMSGGTGTSITNNIILNTNPHVRSYKYAAWTGFGICNLANARIKTSGNTFSGNYKGNIYT